jgi:hypothetical protein
MALRPLSEIYETTIGHQASSPARILFGHLTLNAASVCFSPPRLTKTFTPLGLGAGPTSVSNGPSASCLGELVVNPQSTYLGGPQSL